MNLPDGLLSPALLWLFNLILGGVLVWAFRCAPWRLFLAVSTRQHLFLASCLLLVLLWGMRAEVGPALSIHFLGMSALTLMFGWPLALFAGTLIMAAFSLLGHAGWTALGVNTLITTAIPVGVTHALFLFSRRFLPPNFFVYIFVPGFLGAALGVLTSVLMGTALLVGTGVYDAQHLWHDYLPYLPLVMLPEAVLNGMILTALVALKPDWVATFDDDFYIRNR